MVREVMRAYSLNLVKNNVYFLINNEIRFKQVNTNVLPLSLKLCKLVTGTLFTLRKRDGSERKERKTIMLDG